MNKNHKEYKPEITKSEVTYCKICRSEFELKEFKEYSVCEDCVNYVRENF